MLNDQQFEVGVRGPCTKACETALEQVRGAGANDEGDWRAGSERDGRSGGSGECGAGAVKDGCDVGDGWIVQGAGGGDQVGMAVEQRAFDGCQTAQIVDGLQENRRPIGLEERLQGRAVGTDYFGIGVDQVGGGCGREMLKRAGIDDVVLAQESDVVSGGAFDIGEYFAVGIVFDGSADALNGRGRDYQREARSCCSYRCGEVCSAALPPRFVRGRAVTGGDPADCSQGAEHQAVLHPAEAAIKTGLIVQEPANVCAILFLTGHPDSSIRMTHKHYLAGEAVTQYIRTTLVRETDVQRRLREETAAHPLAVMQISPEQGAFLHFLVKAFGVKRALEVGVFTGYSSLAVALAMPPEGRITACDVSEEYTAVARRYWKEAGVADRIDLRIAPAADSLRALIHEGASGTYDFAFIDANKPGYDEYYELALTLLRLGGVMMLDNMLYHGQVPDEAFQDESTRVLRDLNLKISRDARVAGCLLPFTDGVFLATKLQATQL